MSNMGDREEAKHASKTQIGGVDNEKRVMDKDPEKEIEQMKESQASTHLSLVQKFEEMMISGHTRVLVRCVPSLASVEDVKDVFSCCGKIEFVELKRLKSVRLKSGTVAFVTYKEPEEARCAYLLKSPIVCNHDVYVLRVFNRSPQSGSADCFKFHNSFVDDGDPTLEIVEKFISSMRGKALQKHEELATKLLSFNDAKAACGAEGGDATVQVKEIITGTADTEMGTGGEDEPSRKRKTRTSE